MEYIYVLAITECSFGEWSIYGVYNEMEKLKSDYMYLITSEDSQIAYLKTGKRRQAFVLKYPLNEFVGITPKWNDNKLVVIEELYDVNMDELILIKEGT